MKISIIKTVIDSNLDTFKVIVQSNNVCLRFDDYSEKKVSEMKDWLLSIAEVFCGWTKGYHNRACFMLWIVIGGALHNSVSDRLIQEAKSLVRQSISVEGFIKFANLVEEVYCILDCLIENPIVVGTQIYYCDVRETVAQRTHDLLNEDALKSN